MSKKILASAVCLMSIQGCAYGPYQHHSDPELSVAANVAHNLSNGFTTNIQDGETAMMRVR